MSRPCRAHPWLPPGTFFLHILYIKHSIPARCGHVFQFFPPCVVYCTRAPEITASERRALTSLRKISCVYFICPQADLLSRGKHCISGTSVSLPSGPESSLSEDERRHKSPPPSLLFYFSRLSSLLPAHSRSLPPSCISCVSCVLTVEKRIVNCG